MARKRQIYAWFRDVFAGVGVLISIFWVLGALGVGDFVALYGPPLWVQHQCIKASAHGDDHE